MKEEKEDLFSHLKLCVICRQSLEDAEAYSLHIRSCRPSITAPHSLRNAVLTRIRETRSSVGPTSVSLKPAKAAQLQMLPVVAAVLVMVVIGLFVFSRHRKDNIDTMVQAAVLSHQQLEQNVIPLDVTSGSSQVVSSWFASRLPFPFRMADAGMAAEDKAKYKLTGGRLVTVGNEQAALLSFRLAHDVVSMLVGPEHLSIASGGTAIQSNGITFHSNEQGSLHVVTWNNRGLSYVLTSSKSMVNTRKCSFCHEDRTSGKESSSEAAMLYPRLARSWASSPSH
ncbi:hypothetical protein BDD14_4674 [Edaphobacter modestus]|uniref:Uncharacterized protein n=1 Tax=Edaphobacter modestus TaxID=388466 RepID=A0A4Q7YZ22_9BACT|nr:hypothetical protein BDD14_4674 [Edaphobacter modestus]